MTPGTSPQWGIPFPTGTEAIEHRNARRWPLLARGLDLNWRWLARGLAALHLFGLTLIVTMGWHDPGLAGTATMGGFQATHLAFLMTTGAAVALLTLGRTENTVLDEPADEEQTTPGVDRLLAQMSHELRTPLNAMIGFSEVMLRELYGPLGDARYQEYAAHISESGGQLLRSAEDALAVTETMSAVMADKLAGRCERVTASALVREAWAGVGSASGIKLSVSNGAACDIPCVRRATSQALQHLLREATARTSHGGTVEVRGRRRGGARSIEIRVLNGTHAAPAPALNADAQNGSGHEPLAGDSLRVILARLLLEMQGATLSLWDCESGPWSACVAFPPRGR